MTTDKQSMRIEDWMTKTPCLVDEGLSVADAQQRMYVNNIRHLAVVRGQRLLVGVVSSRDLAVAAAVSSKETTKIPVSDAMIDDPFTCTTDASLADVAFEMEAHRYGCAIVLEGKRPIGIFTTTDALRALRQLILGRPVEAASPPTHNPEHSKERKHIELTVHAGDSLSAPVPGGQGMIRF